IQMVNHGLSVVGLFFIIDILQERTGSRNLSDLGGLAHRMPRLAAMFLIILMGAVGLPLTDGFIREFLLLKGLFDYNLWYAAVGGLTLILGAVYMLRFYQKAMLGPSQERYIVADIRGHEVAVLAVIVFFTLFLGDRKSTRLNSSHVKISYA